MMMVYESGINERFNSDIDKNPYLKSVYFPSKIFSIKY